MSPSRERLESASPTLLEDGEWAYDPFRELQDRMEADEQSRRERAERRAQKETQLEFRARRANLLRSHYTVRQRAQETFLRERGKLMGLPEPSNRRKSIAGRKNEWRARSPKRATMGELDRDALCLIIDPGSKGMVSHTHGKQDPHTQTTIPMVVRNHPTTRNQYTPRHPGPCRPIKSPQATICGCSQPGRSAPSKTMWVDTVNFR
jgi:hypothetical protein